MEKWTLRLGAYYPAWLSDAFQMGLVVPVKDAGTNLWGQHGLRIVRSGVVVPLGETIYRDALPWPDPLAGASA